MDTFETAGPVGVEIDVLCGNVRVVASDRVDTVVEVLPTDGAKKADVRAAERTRVEMVGGTVRVAMPRNWRTYAPFGGNASIQVTVQVPTGSRVRAEVGVGNIHGVGELGECEVELALGDIVVERPLGSVSAKNCKGDIRIGEAVRGAMRLQTSMGDLEIGVRPGSAVQVETISHNGSARSAMGPVAATGPDTVHVFAQTALGNVVIRHTAA
ncbi:hypothetical protein VMT65_19120 [Nocardia sp. CDC153]|uniref:hypothetical protein n=1 Tax=Nocardia sp. CDC153 TaxID=3112167 RepID=UPI002DB73344|nr:hypothetical protein [Nocardia sp. CDC153]MEC3955161.1 hypothetical protein [Nocardia sp. CDC153]